MTFFQKVVLILGLAFAGHFSYYFGYERPRLQNQIRVLSTPSDPIVVYKPGKIDTLYIYTTESRVTETDAPTPLDTISQQGVTFTNWTTKFGDEILSGEVKSLIRSDGWLESTEVTYAFRNPVVSVLRVDTVFVTNQIGYVGIEKKLRLQVGLGLGVNWDKQLYFGPSVGLLTPNLSSFGYMWDTKNNVHWIQYKQGIKL